MASQFGHDARAQHQTLGVQRLAVKSEDYWEYRPEQRVQTCDGFPGTVTAVSDGFHPGSEEYQVTLDGGMGGGTYTASQLSPAPTVTAAAGTAAEDYPELAQVLVDRPDPARHHVYASSKPPWAKDDDDDSSDDSSDDSDDDDSSGKSDKGPDNDGDDDSGSGKDDDKNDDDSDDDSDKDDSDNAPPWAKKKASLFDSLILTAALDADFRFHVTSAWKDVVAKAKRIRSEGGVRVTLASDGILFAEVKGDHDVYEAGLQRLPGRTAAQSWSCGCKWGAYHWGADDDFSRFAGRMCSHALALQYEAQSRGMFGRDINADEHKPAWVPRKVVIRYDIDSGQNQLVRSSAKTASEGHSQLYRGLHLGEATPEEVEHLHRDPVGYLQQHGFDSKRAGIHWTDSPHSASNFAMDRDPEGNGHEGDFWDDDQGDGPTHTHGVVLHGRVAPHHILEPGSEEWHNYADTDAIFDHDHPEQERTVRGDAPVHITHVTAVSSHPGGGWDRETTVPWGHHVTASSAPADAPLYMLARAAVAAGEDHEEVLLALSVVGSVSSPFGEPSSGTSYQLPHAPGATKPRRANDNPASSGPFIGADPVGWQSELPTGSLDDRLGAADHSLFEPTLRTEAMPSWSHPEHPQGFTSQDEHVHTGGNGWHMRTLHGLIGGDHAGALSYEVHPEGKALSVGNLETDPGNEGKGVASALMDHLHELHPNAWINHGHRSNASVDEDGELREDGEGSGDRWWAGYKEPAPSRNVHNVHPDDGDWTKYFKASDVLSDMEHNHQIGRNGGYGDVHGTTWDHQPYGFGGYDRGRVNQWDAMHEPYMAQHTANATPEASMFEPGGVEATLDDEPEGALPATDGVSIPSDDEALTPSMTASLSKRAMADFSLKEQQELINEGEGVKAANLDRLQIEGTHYAELEHVLAAADDDTTWMA